MPVSAPNDRRVFEVQSYLARLGFPIGSSGPDDDGVDGVMGEMTREALRAFQVLRGLPATGEPDAKTIRALAGAASAGRSVRDLARKAPGARLDFSIRPDAPQAAFINAVYIQAVLNEDRTGVPAAITAAQAALESAYGRSVPRDYQDGRYSHNLFAIRGQGPAGFVTSWDTDYVAGREKRVLAPFRAYRDYLESIADHSGLLTGAPRYAALFTGSDPAHWARGLQTAGYATDPRYAEKLMGIVRYWGLK